MDATRALEEYASVERWARGLKEQWGGDPLAEDPARLDSLREFCAFVGRDPDELVAYCFLRRRATGERFVSVKRRGSVAAQISEFRERGNLDAAQGRRLQSHILSFLIHNGVQMNPGAG